MQNMSIQAALQAAEQMLEGMDGSCVLRVIIDNMLYPITVDILKQVPVLPLRFPRFCQLVFCCIRSARHTPQGLRQPGLQPLSSVFLDKLARREHKSCNQDISAQNWSQNCLSDSRNLDSGISTPVPHFWGVCPLADHQTLCPCIPLETSTNQTCGPCLLTSEDLECIPSCSVSWVALFYMMLFNTMQVHSSVPWMWHFSGLWEQFCWDAVHVIIGESVELSRNRAWVILMRTHYLNGWAMTDSMAA